MLASRFYFVLQVAARRRVCPLPKDHIKGDYILPLLDAQPNAPNSAGRDFVDVVKRAKGSVAPVVAK